MRGKIKRFSINNIASKRK